MWSSYAARRCAITALPTRPSLYARTPTHSRGSFHEIPPSLPVCLSAGFLSTEASTNGSTPISLVTRNHHHHLLPPPPGSHSLSRDLPPSSSHLCSINSFFLEVCDVNGTTVAVRRGRDCQPPFHDPHDTPSPHMYTMPGSRGSATAKEMENGAEGERFLGCCRRLKPS